MWKKRLVLSNNNKSQSIEGHLEFGVAHGSVENESAEAEIQNRQRRDPFKSSETHNLEITNVKIEERRVGGDVGLMMWRIGLFKFGMLSRQWWDPSRRDEI